MKAIAIAATIGVLAAGTAMADDQDTFELGYLECWEIRDNKDERLACYDDLLMRAGESFESAVFPRCVIEDWNHDQTSERTRIVGAATCKSGKLNFRLYDGDEFLTSGSTYIDGFAFQTFANIETPPEQLGIKYTIEPR